MKWSDLHVGKIATYTWGFVVCLSLSDPGGTQFKDTVFPLPLPCRASPCRLGFTPEMVHLGWPSGLSCLLMHMPHITTGGSTRDSLFWQTEERTDVGGQPSSQEFWIIHHVATPSCTFYLVIIRIHWCQSVLLLSCYYPVPGLVQFLLFFGLFLGLLTVSCICFFSPTQMERNIDSHL